MRARAHRGGWLQRWLATSLAALLSIAPLVRPAWIIDFPASTAASIESVDTRDGGLALPGQPAAGPPLAQLPTIGILSRLASLETAIGLPPLKSSPIRSNAPDEASVFAPATMVFGSEQIFHRSSVGTARTPTGPPS